MQKLKKDLKDVTKALKALTRKVEQIQKQIEKVGKSKVAKAKPAKTPDIKRTLALCPSRYLIKRSNEETRKNIWRCSGLAWNANLKFSPKKRNATRKRNIHLVAMLFFIHEAQRVAVPTKAEKLTKRDKIAISEKETTLLSK